MNQRQQQELLQEGYRCVLGNPFWQWFYQQLDDKRQYLGLRLGEAKSWEEVCRVQGGMTVLNMLAGLCADIAAYESDSMIGEP
ncbi:MAG: hypothetical protein RR387_00625 [Clostridiales bacterium]